MLKSTSVNIEDSYDIKLPDEYVGLFTNLYPTNTKGKSTFKISDLRALHLSMFEAYTAYDSLMALLTSCLKRAGYIEMSDVEEVKSYVIPIVKAIESANEINEESNWKDICNRARQNFSVLDSSKYDGGLDIAFTGSVGIRPGISRAGRMYNDSISLYNTGDYETAHFQHYGSELGQKILSLIKKVRNYVFGGQGEDSTTKELTKAFKHDALNLAQFKGEFMSLFPALSPDTVDFLFPTVTIFKNPNVRETYSLAVRSSMGSSLRNRTLDDVSEEGRWANVNVSFGLMMHLPKPVLEYATQEKPYSKSNLVSWIQEWVSTAFLVPAKRGGKSTRSAKNISSVVSSPKVLEGVVEKRESMGLVGTVEMFDDDGLYFARSGNPSYLPKARVMKDNIKTYEKFKKDLFEFCMKNNLPYNEHYAKAFEESGIQDKKIHEDLRSIVDEGSKCFGTVLGYDTAYGAILYLNSRGKMCSTVLNGSRKPDSLTMANLLGYDFAGESGSGYTMSSSQTFARFMHSDAEQQSLADRGIPPKSAKEIEMLFGPQAAAISVIYETTVAYLSQAFNGNLPDPNILLADVVTELFESGDDEQNEHYKTLNSATLNTNLVDLDGRRFVNTDYPKIITDIVRLFGAALSDSSGNPSVGSGLFYVTQKSHGSSDMALVMSEAEASDNYFHLDAPFEKFRALRNYLGGRLIMRMCKELLTLDETKLLGPLNPIDNPDVRTDASGKELDSSVYPIEYTRLTSSVIPFALIVTKHLDRVEEYWAAADEHIARKQQAAELEATDLILPGVKDGAAVFPHQLTALGELRTDPEFAILDIDPGGGKTLSTIYNIMDMLGRGINVKPLVLCPDRLVTNWCDDISKATEGTWNTVPLATSASGMDENDLLEFLRNLPPNTIVIAGLKWITSGPLNSLGFGGFKANISYRSDILRSAEFNYVAVDESQNLKNFTAQSFSATHEAGKLITTFPSVKWIRLATGTFIHNTLVDAVGQTALFSSGIFGDSRFFDFGKEDTRKDAAKVRSKLGQFVSMVTRRRKEWAFMLPNPIDALIAVDAFEPAPGKEGIARIIHKSVYENLLGAAIEKIRTGKTDSSDVLETKDGDEITDASEIEDMATDDADDDGQGANEIKVAAAQTYLQRVEAILTDPWGDIDFQTAAREAELEPSDYVPVKVQAVHQRLDVHYTPAVQSQLKSEGKKAKVGQVFKWEPNMDLKELDRVEDDGQEYMVRRIQSDTYKRQEVPKSSARPKDAPDLFKPEKKGKVLIFCRFVREVEYIYDSLPEKYKSKAVKFHSKVENADANLDAFVNDPAVEILVANEQGIKEGHNMQIASRIIRVATPWTPGDYEQATARIFRPDVAAALKAEDGKAGDMERELIYIDWVCSQNTLEVPKIARLMAKTVEKVQFDEDGNDHYDRITQVPEDPDDSDFSSLQPIRMNYKILLEENNTSHYMRDPVTGEGANRDYFGAKATLNDLQQQEFSKMRAESVSRLLPVEVTPPKPDFAKMEVMPMAANQHLRISGLKVTRGSDKVSETVAAYPGNLQGFKQALRLKPVITPYGKGVIVGMSMRTDEKHPVSMFKVRIADKAQLSGELFSVSPLHIHFVEDLDKTRYDAEYKTSKPFSTKSEEAKHAKAEADRELANKKAKAKKGSKSNPKITGRTATNSAKRKDNKRKNKPINDGVVTKVDKVGSVADGQITETKTGKPAVELDITMFNGWLTIVANLEDPDVESFDDEFGFRELNPFMYIELTRAQHIERLDEWMEKNSKKFHYAKATEQMLDLVFEEAFRTDNKNMFDFKLAAKTLVDLPKFFMSTQRLLKDKKAVRMYPCIMQDRVRLMVDLKTNPVFKPQLNQKIPGIPGNAGKWTRQEGASIFFATSKGELNSVLRKIAQSYTISNANEVADQLTAIKPYRGKVAPAI